MNKRGGVVLYSPKDYLIRKVSSPPTQEELSHFVFNRYQEAYSQYGWVWDFESDIRQQDEKYDPHSVVFGAFDYEAKILGSLKIILPRPIGKLPIERDFGISCEDVLRATSNPRRNLLCVEIARFAVHRLLAMLKERGPHLIAFSLIKESILESARIGVDAWFASIDVQVWRWLYRAGLRFEKFQEPRMYLGSPTVPVILQTDKAKGDLKTLNPPLWDFIYKESGG